MPQDEIILHCRHCEHCQQAVSAAAKYHFRESDEKHEHCAVCAHWCTRQCPVSPKDYAPNHGLCDHFMWPPKDWCRKEQGNG